MLGGTLRSCFCLQWQPASAAVRSNDTGTATATVPFAVT